MITFSSEDAPCMLFAAEYRIMPPAEAALLLQSVKEPKAKLVFQALMKDESEWGEYPEDVVSAAKTLLDGVKRHRQIAEELCRRPCPHCGHSPSGR